MSSGQPDPKDTAAAIQHVAQSVGAKTEAIKAVAVGDVARLYGEAIHSNSVETVTTRSSASGVTPVQAQSAASRSNRLDSASVPSSYVPADKVKFSYLQTLDQYLVTNGAGPEAVGYLRVRYRDMLERLSPETLKNLVDEKVHLEIIPEGKELTDVGPFQVLKGKKTFDGRVWDTVRGVADVSMDHGGQAVAVGEENFLASGGGYAKGFLFFHEFGHAVMDAGLPAHGPTPPPPGLFDNLYALLIAAPSDFEPSRGRIASIYQDAMKRPQKTDLGDYANSNDREFWGQASAAYFGAGYSYMKDAVRDGKKTQTLFQETPVSLRAADQAIYMICAQVYGKSGRYWEKK